MVQGFSGPLAGKEGKVLSQPGDKPRVLIFVHEVTRPAYQLLRPVDALYAIIGKDVSRSLSPRLHNAAYRSLGLPAFYLPMTAARRTVRCICSPRHPRPACRIARPAASPDLQHRPTCRIDEPGPVLLKSAAAAERCGA